MSIPRNGLRQLAIVSLLVALAVFLPWMVLTVAALWIDVTAGRWLVRQWRRKSEPAQGQAAGTGRPEQPEAAEA